MSGVGGGSSGGVVVTVCTITNGLSEVTLAQIVLLPKSGAGAAGARMVRSTNAPPSPWRIRSAENAAASPANDGTLRHTVAPPLNAAVVLEIECDGAIDGEAGGNLRWIGRR